MQLTIAAKSRFSTGAWGQGDLLYCTNSGFSHHFSFLYPRIVVAQLFFQRGDLALLLLNKLPHFFQTRGRCLCYCSNVHANNNGENLLLHIFISLKLLNPNQTAFVF